jgi:hypothetical protein
LGVISSLLREEALMNLAGLLLSTTALTLGQPGERLEFRLGNGLENLPLITLHGRDAQNGARGDGRGLRIRLPVNKEPASLVYVEARFRVRGDFEITAGYELVAIGKPPPSEGAGVSLSVRFDSARGPRGSLDRLNTPAGDVFRTDWTTAAADGKSKHDWATTPAKAAWGRLRLVRTGEKMQYAAADGGRQYRELRAENVGKDDVEQLRFTCTNSWSVVPVDIRLLDLTVQASAVVNESSMLQRQTAPVPWWVFVSLGLLVVFLLWGVRSVLSRKD